MSVILNVRQCVSVFVCLHAGVLNNRKKWIEGKGPKQSERSVCVCVCVCVCVSHLMLALHSADPYVVLVRLPCSLLYT